MVVEVGCLLGGSIALDIAFTFVEDELVVVGEGRLVGLGIEGGKKVGNEGGGG